MEGISVAQSTKAKKTPKVLKRMEIEPRLGGGHVITHHYSSFQHEPESHEFEEHEGEKAMKHIAHHAGLPHPKPGEQEGSEPEEEAE